MLFVCRELHHAPERMALMGSNEVEHACDNRSAHLHITPTCLVSPIDRPADRTQTDVETVSEFIRTTPGCLSLLEPATAQILARHIGEPTLQPVPATAQKKPHCSVRRVPHTPLTAQLCRL